VNSISCVIGVTIVTMISAWQGRSKRQYGSCSGCLVDGMLEIGVDEASSWPNFSLPFNAAHIV
jgi:hypothetical protein